MMKKEWLKNAYSEHFTTAPKKVTDLVVERGAGVYLYTIDGERYLDFVQGVAVNALGHCHPALTAAAASQLQQLGHASFNLVSYPSALILAAELRKWTGRLDKFFFTNSGAEGVESALKLARYVSAKSTIIAFRGAFHGRTMGAASVTASSAKFRKHYAPFLPQVYFAPYPYCFRCPFHQEAEACSLDCLAYLLDDFEHFIPLEDVSAVLFEPVMGEGGYVVPPKKYVEVLARFCSDNKILLMFDEVQSGIGRTGHMFAYQHFGIEPDILILGKAVGGGYPLAVVAANRQLMDQWPPGSHGSTFGGHPVACAAGSVQLEHIGAGGFLESVAAKGDYFKRQLIDLQKKHREIGDVRGIGLMNAIELIEPGGSPDAEKAAAIVSHMFSQKILVYTCGVRGNILRFMPPLNVETDVLNQVIDVLDQSFFATRKESV
ncbi:MAG: aminotransferase class III-fold pyridoxal phosphate-dependent enzyme [Desulfobacterales bacterium]|nr:MAG: aminotransferase class III-fold pyridoxal phosphate-dependent enzyme [Desulfobacterales bacterium]